MARAKPSHLLRELSEDKSPEPLHPFAENLLALWTESMPRNHRYLATPCASSRAACLSSTRLVEFSSESRRFHCFSSCSRQFASSPVTAFLGPGIELRDFSLA